MIRLMRAGLKSLGLSGYVEYSQCLYVFFFFANAYRQKMLACGDIGIGGMREWAEVVSVIEERLSLNT